MIPTHVFKTPQGHPLCLSFCQRYVPKNKYKEVKMFNPKEEIGVLLGVPHWCAPHQRDINGKRHPHKRRPDRGNVYNQGIDRVLP